MSKSKFHLWLCPFKGKVCFHASQFWRKPSIKAVLYDGFEELSELNKFLLRMGSFNRNADWMKKCYLCVFWNKVLSGVTLVGQIVWEILAAQLIKQDWYHNEMKRARKHTIWRSIVKGSNDNVTFAGIWLSGMAMSGVGWWDSFESNLLCFMVELLKNYFLGWWEAIKNKNKRCMF